MPQLTGSASDLVRFLRAQDAVYEIALLEIESGGSDRVGARRRSSPCRV